MDVGTSSSDSTVEIETGAECSGSNTQEAGTQKDECIHPSEAQD